MNHVTQDASSLEKLSTDWDAARECFEHDGLSMREIALQFGVSPNTVSVHARKDGWERDSAAAKARDEQRRSNAQAAIEATKVQWAQRRAIEADEAGASAQFARLQVIAAMVDRDWHMVAASATAYGIFIDKAQLLSGGVTSRSALVDDDRLARSRTMRDELADRRERLAS